MLRGFVGCALGFVFLACGARTELEDNGASSTAPATAPAADGCKPLAACGGDLVGTWTINSQCSSPAADYILRTMCSDAKETRSISGTMSFSADGTLISTLQVGYRDVLPPFCAGNSCGVDNEVYAGCTPGDAGDCICDFPSSGTSMQQTYQIVGQAVILDQNNDPMLTPSYCVQGDELFLSTGDNDESYNLQLERDNGQ